MCRGTQGRLEWSQDPVGGVEGRARAAYALGDEHWTTKPSGSCSKHFEEARGAMLAPLGVRHAQADSGRDRLARLPDKGRQLRFARPSAHAKLRHWRVGTDPPLT
jgi:hypothetical protein